MQIDPEGLTIGSSSLSLWIARTDVHSVVGRHGVAENGSGQNEPGRALEEHEGIPAATRATVKPAAPAQMCSEPKLTEIEPALGRSNYLLFLR